MKLLLHLVLFFTFLISLFLLLCKVLLNEFTGAQVWEELVLLRNCLSYPSNLALRALLLTDMAAAHSMGGSKEASFAQAADSDTQDVWNFSFQAVDCHSSTRAALLSTVAPIKRPFPHHRAANSHLHRERWITFWTKSHDPSQDKGGFLPAGCWCSGAMQLARLFNTQDNWY